MPHSRSHSGQGHHRHDHGPGAHPAQPPRWSILAMALPARLGAALAVSAVLWVGVWMALR